MLRQCSITSIEKLQLQKLLPYEQLSSYAPTLENVPQRGPNRFRRGTILKQLELVVRNGLHYY